MASAAEQRCEGCGKLLGRASEDQAGHLAGNWQTRCPRCSKMQTINLSELARQASSTVASGHP